MTVPSMRRASSSAAADLPLAVGPAMRTACGLSGSERADDELQTTGTATKRARLWRRRSGEATDFRPTSLTSSTLARTSCGSLTRSWVTSTMTSPGFTRFSAAGLSGSTLRDHHPLDAWPIRYQCGSPRSRARWKGRADPHAPSPPRPRLFAAPAPAPTPTTVPRILREPSDGRLQAHGLAVTEDFDLDSLADRRAGDGAGQSAHGVDCLAVELVMMSVVLRPAAAAGPSGAMLATSAPAGSFKPRLVAISPVTFCTCTPSQPRRVSPKLLELIDDLQGAVRGHRKADADRAAGRREDGRVHADDLAVHVEKRPAGIAAVDGGVGLQEIVVGT